MEVKTHAISLKDCMHGSMEGRYQENLCEPYNRVCMISNELE